MIEIENVFYRIDYRFSSPIGDIDTSRYITTIYGEVLQDLEEEDFGKNVIVGRIKLQLILVSLAFDSQYGLMEIFDNSQSLSEIGEIILDIENNELKEVICEYYDTTFLENNDICIIDRIEILPRFRGKRLGKKIIKDIYNRFSGSCGLFVLKAFPLQFEVRTNKSLWNDNMELNLFNHNEKKAKQKLINFYTQCGFNKISTVSEELMFLNPMLINTFLE